MISVLICARNEELLCRTVEDLFNKAEGSIEVIVVMDGPTNYPLNFSHPGLRIIDRFAKKNLIPGWDDDG